MILNRVIVRRELLWLTIFFFLIKALSPYLVEYMIVGCICRIIRFLGDRFHISLLFMCVHDNLFLLKSSVGLLHLGNEISWIQYEDISYKNTWLAMSPYYAILFLSAFLGLFGLSSFFSCTTLGTENPLFFFFTRTIFWVQVNTSQVATASMQVWVATCFGRIDTLFDLLSFAC